MSVSVQSLCLLNYAFLFRKLPPPPRSTLFPYTTLFRSLGKASLKKFASAIQSKMHDDPQYLLMLLSDVIEFRKDRKSTRLNSSHRCISYAVFCLKKKKQQQSPP